jgi:hypothetical protein
MKKSFGTLRLVKAGLLGTLTAGVQPHLAQAGALRAGSENWLAGQAGITVVFSAPVANKKYAAVVQPANTAGYSPTTDCTYFNVLHKSVNGFDVQHKTCLDGTPVPLDVNLQLNWIVEPYK